MKNISFGDLIERKELPKISKKQNAIGLIASEYIESSQLKNGSYVILSDKVESDMDADILLIHKKDGSVELKLREIPGTRRERGFSWIKKEDNTPLVIRPNCSMKNARKKISEYASKLWLLADKYYGIISNDEKFYTGPKPLTAEQKAALDEIEAEEEFEKEFHTNLYN